jgi:LAO/AO transport system kinase
VNAGRRAPAAVFHDAMAGDRSAVARLLSMVERGGDDARAVARLVHPLTGGARTVGITGAPGAGKSTLTGALIGELRRQALRVGVLAIDPSSPLTGGAILGDRVRMQDHATDPGVTIRSMATRGHLGGLSLATPEAIRVLDAVGMDVVVVETVGVGQVEVDIARRADTTVVVVNPGWGDAIQANKAGLMEIADVFVVNKADRPGAEDTRRDLEAMLDLAGRTDPHGWRPPVLLTEGTSGRGVGELWVAVEAHRQWAQASGEHALRRQRRRRDELNEIVMRRLEQRAREQLGQQRWDVLLDEVVQGRRDPWSAADELLG